MYRTPKAFSRHRRPPAARGSRVLAIAVSLLLAACGPNIRKADGYETLSDNLVTAKAYPAAADAIQRSIKYDGNEPRRWLKLARIQRSMELPALAAGSYQHALDLDPANTEALQNLAILLVRAGRYEEARAYVDPLLVLSPDDVAGLLALGAIALYQKHYDEAAKYADKLMDLAPASIGGYSLKGHVLEARGLPAEGAKLLQQRLDLDPDDADLALQLLDLYRKSGNVGGVQRTSLVLARLRPNEPRYQLESARALHAQHQDREAATVIAALQKRYSGNPGIMVAIADYWQSVLPRDEAVARMTAMTEAAGGLTRAALADQLVTMGALPAVLRLLAPVAMESVDSNNVDVQASYAAALLAAGQAAEARSRAAAVLAFDPSNDKALLVRARDAFARGDLAHALTDAQVVANDAPADETAALLVPAIYAAMGNRSLAARAYGEAQQSLPDSIAIHKARIDWLIGIGNANDAMQIAAVYARGHARAPAAIEVYKTACRAAKDPHCARGLNIDPDSTE